MRERGFTLVEVMVALAVVAIALPALMVTLYGQMDDTAYLRDKTLAQMVAANKLAETRLVVASSRQVTAGKSTGVVSFVDRDWHWWLESTTTPVNNFLRFEIRVALEETQKETPLYTLSAFMQGDRASDNLFGGQGQGGGGGGDDAPPITPSTLGSAQ
ncbi:MAG: type II secretion system minor pseudopilin GspI [Halioglobus sp.]